MEPKVSIIVPVYKVEQYLERCVKSILKQTYTDYEIILVDDGSPDRCPQMCDCYAKEHGKITVVHKENGGLSSARLAGFERASGEYILFIDSDDYIAETMVEKLVTAMEAENAELAMCSYCTVCGGQIEARKLPYQSNCIQGSDKVVLDYILPLIGKEKDGINIPGFLCIRMFKRELIQKDFFQSERKYFLEDHIFNLLYADYVRKIAIVNEPLYFYIVNRASLSNCYRKEKYQMYVKLYQFYVSYIKKRNIKFTEKRLDNFWRSALFATIDNAVQAGSYVAYRKELDLIIKDTTVKSMINRIDFKELSSMQKVILLLYRAKMYRMLYSLRKKRMESVGV